jgi:hypothetical protein
VERTLLVVSLAWAGLLACAAPTLPEIPPSHPASPLAAEAALAPASEALAPPEATARTPDGVADGKQRPSEHHGAHHGH